MIYQHNPQRFRYRTMGGRICRIGTAGKAGDWRTLRDGRTVQIEGWIPRDYTAHHRDANGHWQSVRMAGGHLAQVRDVRTGRCFKLAEQYLRDPDED